jgi:L-fuconolactonase
MEIKSVTLHKIRTILSIFSLLCLMNTTSLAKEPWIIDPHTHFKGKDQIAYEATKIKRVKQDTLGKVVKPEDYRSLADRLEIQSTMVVEAVDQDKPEFNDWLLEQAKSDLVCGYVARGDLNSKDFSKNYKRYKATGYLKGYRFRFDELKGYLQNEDAKKHLSTLEKDGMVVDLLIETSHLNETLELAKKYPKLKIIINHCFRIRMKDQKIPDEWKKAITETAKFPNVYCKISSILNLSDIPPFKEPGPTDMKFYKPILDHCFNEFGEDRVIFATNWGVCTHFGKVDDVVRIVKEFLETKGETALKKGMRDNAIKVYNISPEHLR